MTAAAKKNEVATVEAQPVAQISDAGSLMAVISRAASDPTVNIEKLERLMAMYERITAGQAKAAYDEALAAMQPKLPVITEHGKIIVNNEVRSTYAKWEDINDVIKPILAEHRFALTHRVTHRDNKILVTAILSHGGHREETTMELPPDKSGSKNDAQAVGSSTSYGQRYTATLLLNITSRGEDNDGGAPKRENPHVTRPEDVSDAKPRYDERGNRIDWVDTSGHRMQRLSKAQARPLANELNIAMRKCKTAAYLVEWGVENSEKVAQLPSDWEEIFQSRYQEYLDELRAQKAPAA